MNNVQVLQQPIIPSTCNKPIELYIFIDPLDNRSLALQLTLRKLQVEYGHYFTCRYVLSTELSSLNTMTNRMKGCVTGAELDITHPALPFIAIKAAELQGKRAGFRYLNKVQEVTALKTHNINSHAALIEIAQHIDLDMNEFMADFGSKEAARAFQCDLYLTREMEVEEIPSIVFFNECIEDEGLKVCGSYNYEVYEHILAELLGEELIRQQAPALDELFTRFPTLTTAEVAEIYSIKEQAAERELKKRMLQQKVERLMTDDITFWRAK